MLSTPTRPSGSKARPGLDTPFHIDYEWWKRDGHDLRAYLLTHLLPDQRKQFENGAMEGEIDWVDPVTAEVRRIDAIQLALVKAAADANYINDHTTLVDAVFRVLLANSNKPLSPNELGQLTKRSAQTILRTLAGTTGQVYKGIRPTSE